MCIIEPTNDCPITVQCHIVYNTYAIDSNCNWQASELFGVYKLTYYRHTYVVRVPH